MLPKPDRHQDMRDAMRALCAGFPAEYHRKHGAEATYPVEFIDALTKAGWLAAMIPEEYGGSNLGLIPIRIGHDSGRLHKSSAN